MFTASVNELMIEVKDFIEQKMKDSKVPLSPPAASAADEIKKLAELKAQGLLSDEEFTAAKKKLLGV